jgi:hypothetical protein
MIENHVEISLLCTESLGNREKFAQVPSFGPRHVNLRPTEEETRATPPRSLRPVSYFVITHQ